MSGILSNSELEKMKDELCSTTNGDELTNDTIKEAFFHKAKAFCYTTDKGEEGKKLKGLTKAIIKNQITIEEYKNAIHDAKSKDVTNYTIDSNKHHLKIKEQNKIAIDPFDDKVIKSCNGEFRFYQ